MGEYRIETVAKSFLFPKLRCLSVHALGVVLFAILLPSEQMLGEVPDVGSTHQK